MDRNLIAMVTGVLTIRGHAGLNDLSVSEPKWWALCVFSVICLRVFVWAVRS